MKNRLKYLTLVIAVVLTGLASRRFSAADGFIHNYVGDALWAAMIYFGFRFLKPILRPRWTAVAALIFCFLIEISQLYQAEWLNTIRRTTLGGLVLGFGFLWSDFVCYSVGVFLAWIIDEKLFKSQD